MYFYDAVETIRGMQTLTDKKEDMILSGNTARRLDL